MASVIAMPAYAQTGGLESVTTTARRQEETLLDVPVAVSVVSSEALGRYGANNLSQIGDMIPQVQITRATSGNGGIISIRGITSASGDPGIDTAVSINVDGVQVSRGYIATAAFFDLAQVEVLKGPQALFFGKNSPAGVISLRSKGPGNEWEGFVKAGYEFRAKERFVEAAIGGPVTDKFGIRVAMRYSDMDGWLHNTAGPLANPFEPNSPLPGATNNKLTPASEALVGRVTMEFRPNDRFTAVFKVLGSRYQDNELTGITQVVSCADGQVHSQTRGFFDPNSDCIPDKYRSVGAQGPVAATNYPLSKKGNGEYFTDSKSILASLDLSYDFGAVSLDAVTGFYRLDSNGLGAYDYTGLAYFPGINGEKTTIWSEEVRLTSQYDGPVNFVLGGYYESAKRNSFTVGRGGFSNAVPVDPAVDFVIGYWPEDTSDRETMSGFGQLLWDITDTLQLTGGVRYTKETADIVNQNVYANPAYQGALLPPGMSVAGRIQENNWSPEATLTWHPTADQTIYAAYRTGYKSGGVSQTAILLRSNTFEGLSFGPETAKGGEIGYKAQLAGNRLRLDANLYYYEFSGLQRSSLDIATTSFRTLNAATAVTKGFELEAFFLVTDELMLRGAFTYNNAKYTDWGNAPCFNGQRADEGCDVSVGTTARTQNLTGQPLGLAPKVSTSAGFTYDIPVANWLNVGITGDVKYVSAYWGNDLQQPGSRQKGYAKFNASIRLHEPDDTWELSLIGRNLTNELAILTAGDKPGGARNDVTGVLERGREVILQAQYRF
ncbi:TonB-dependent receptor [Emcibacter sp. SYSU 3D8]|uniref:TonB-dependent receptor n=1 Tax=Emcibacter sp. SYSU 3D8 TaxID=3133969 RepID=UPI0031FEBE88